MCAFKLSITRSGRLTVGVKKHLSLIIRREEGRALLPVNTSGKIQGTPTRFIFRVEFRAAKRALASEWAIVQEFAPHTSSISDSVAHVKVNRYRSEIASKAERKIEFNGARPGTKEGAKSH